MEKREEKLRGLFLWQEMVCPSDLWFSCTITQMGRACSGKKGCVTLQQSGTIQLAADPMCRRWRGERPNSEHLTFPASHSGSTAETRPDFQSPCPGLCSGRARLCPGTCKLKIALTHVKDQSILEKMRLVSFGGEHRKNTYVLGCEEK